MQACVHVIDQNAKKTEARSPPYFGPTENRCP